MTNTLETLAERIEREAGPDRDLDLAIAVALNRDDIFDAHYTWRWGSGGDEIEAWEEDARKPSGYLDPMQFCPRVTASLDAAMSLVPEGWDISAGLKNGEGHAYIHNGECIFTGVGCRKNPARKSEEVTAATPALALTAAALRARAAEEK